MTSFNERKAAQAIQAARLAMSAEQYSTQAECVQAGRTAGAVAHAAGLTLDGLRGVVDGLLQSTLAWDSVVDGWYDSDEAS